MTFSIIFQFETLGLIKLVENLFGILPQQLKPQDKNIYFTKKNVNYDQLFEEYEVFQVATKVA